MAVASMRAIAGPRRMPSMPTLDEDNDLQPEELDFSRADMMTPFSLSLAAEKAIENAKAKLDEMDSRLSTARTTIDRMRSQRLQRAVSDPELPHKNTIDQISQSAGNGIAGPRTHKRIQSVGGQLTREEILHLKTIEMKKLRDDLKALRNRMTTKQSPVSTPPRPVRPSPDQVPDLVKLSKDFDQSTEGRIIKRLSCDLRKATNSPPTQNGFIKPVIEYVGGKRNSMVKSDASSLPSLRSDISSRPSSIIVTSQVSPVRDKRGAYGRLNTQLTPPPSASSIDDDSPRNRSSLPRPLSRSSIPTFRNRPMSSISRTSSLSYSLGDPNLVSRLETALNKLELSRNDQQRRQKLEHALMILEDLD